MKRFFALAALVLGLASCQTEPEELNVQMGGEVDATITVSIPDSETRAGGTNSAGSVFDNGILDGDATMRYILQVYYGENASNERLVKYSDGKEVNFDVRLVPNRDYKFVVWADVVARENAGDNHYDTSDLKDITINTWGPMDESRDAFTDVEEVTNFTGQSSINLELKRPLAKLRVLTTDMQALSNLDLHPKKAIVKYNANHYSSFNAFTGQPTNKDIAAKVHTIADVATYGETGTLFVDYFFATTEQEATKFELTVYDQNGDAEVNTIKYNNFNTDIAVQRNYLTTIKGNILTDGNNVKVTIDDAFDGYNNYVDSAALAQEVLDNAAANTTIYLEPGVDYGTLYLRPINGGAQTKVVDWIGNNYRFETYSLFENLTIVGAEGATIDAIKIEGGTYYNTDHSQKDLYPVMLSLIELKNVVFDGVTFTGQGGYDPQGYGNAVNLSGNNIKVDGLTFKNCVLENSENNARLLYKTESTTHVHNYAYNGENFTFTPSLKNITITGCKLNGGYMGLELREAENVTITNNEFRVSDRNILLPANSGCTYSGYVTITGNVSYDAKERFVRADGMGDAVVVIKDNTLINYQGADADYIKVTNANNVTEENNILISNISTAGQFISALNANGYYEVTNDITIDGPQAGTLATRANDNKKSVIDLNGYTITFANTGTEPIATIEAGNSVTFTGEGSIVAAENSTPAIENKGTVVDETFNVTNEIISNEGVFEFIVSDTQGLINFANAVDAGNTFEGQTITLTADIDLSAENWDPIGDNRTDGAVFSGIFDGQNHTITGAHITGDHCFNGAVYGSKEGWGLFSVTDGATIKNLKVDGAIFGSYTVISGTIAAYANDTTFENINITNSKVAGYNWYTGGVVGWAAGECTFKGVNLDKTVAVGTLWDSHGQNAGGIAGGVSASAVITIEDCNIACVLDVINDVTSNYKWCVYRVAGMIIGNTNTTETKYNEVVTATATNVTCKNVTVTYGKWMNYHYCEGFWNRGWGRYESSDYVGGVDQNEPHNHAEGEEHCECFPFDQLFGGSSNGSGHYPVKGLAEFPGVTVVYPAEYTCPVCGEQHNVVEN